MTDTAPVVEDEDVVRENERVSSEEPRDGVLGQIVGSGDPDYQSEARAAAVERVGEKAYYKDPETYWTAQQGGMPDTGTAAALGPQVYHPYQLPDPDIARAAGIPPQRIPDHLILDEDDIAGHPRGPEPGEAIRIAVNMATNRRMLDETDAADRDHFELTSGHVEDIKAADEQTDAGNDGEGEGDGESSGSQEPPPNKDPNAETKPEPGTGEQVSDPGPAKARGSAKKAAGEAPPAGSNPA